MESNLKEYFGDRIVITIIKKANVVTFRRTSTSVNRTLSNEDGDADDDGKEQ